MVKLYFPVMLAVSG